MKVGKPGVDGIDIAARSLPRLAAALATKSLTQNEFAGPQRPAARFLRLLLWFLSTPLQGHSMTIRSHFAPLLGAMSLGLALTAQAAPVLDQSQTTFTYGSAGYISDTSLAGQSFTVGQSGLLSGVSIYINGFMQGTNTVALRVHSGATLFSGTVLGSASYDVNTSLYNTVTDEFMMDVSSLGIQVSAGEVLNFDIGITGSGDLASSRGILWTASDAYAGGSGSFQLSWFDSQFPNADLTFRTYVDADAGSNVPEPTSLALVGLALGAGSLLRRRVA